MIFSLSKKSPSLEKHLILEVRKLSFISPAIIRFAFKNEELISSLQRATCSLLFGSSII